jgi:hypothetical protein
MYDFNDVYCVYNSTIEKFMERDVVYPVGVDGFRAVWRDEGYHILRGDELKVLDECFKDGHEPVSGPTPMDVINHYFHHRMYRLIITSLGLGDKLWLLKLKSNGGNGYMPDFTSTEIMV